MAYEALPVTSSRDQLHGLIHRNGATVTSSIVNLLNTIVGAGILAMPFAYRANGILLGSIIIILSGIASGTGLYLQALTSRFVPAGHASFFSLAKITYPSLAVLFDIAIAIKCFGVAVSYLIIFGDLMPQVSESLGLQDFPFLLSRQFWLTIAMGIVGPLSFLRRLESLKYTSVIALISVGYLVVVVVLHFVIGDTPPDRQGDVRLFEPMSLPSVLQTLSIIIFAFTCHQNMFSVLNELSGPSEVKWRQIITSSIGSAAFLYVLVGLCGYFSFGDMVGGNIITMYPYSIFSTIGRFAIVILVIFSYPLQCHPCRASLNHILHWINDNWNADGRLRSGEDGSSRGATNRNDGGDNDSNDNNRNNTSNSSNVSGAGNDNSDDIAIEVERRPLVDDLRTRSAASESHAHTHIPRTRFVLLTFGILACSYILSLSVESLELMLAFVGSTGSTSISFILPGIFGYTLFDKSRLGQAKVDIKQAHILQKISMALISWGVVVMIVCLGTNIWMLEQ